MTTTSVAQWSTTAALNVEIDGNDISEGCSPAGINDAIRSVIAQSKTKFSSFDAAIAAITSSGIATMAKDTRANLNADLAHAAGTIALVYADATATNNDLYAKSGASGSGSWSSPLGILAAAAQSYATAAAASAAAAAASAASALSTPDSLQKSIPAIRNIFNQNTVTAASAINASNGVVSANGSQYYVSDYMAVFTGQTLIANYPLFGGSGFGYAWYDSGKTYLSGSAAGVAAATPISVPASAAYLRIMFDTTAIPLASVMLATASTLPAHLLGYNEGPASANLVYASQIASTYRRHRLNLFDPDQITFGQILDMTGALQSIGGYATTGYFPVSPGVGFATYPASSAINSGFGLGWYDKDKNWIGGVAASFTNGQVFTPPERAAYARFPFLATQLSQLNIIPSDVTLSDWATHRLALLSDAQQWAGRNIAQIGDSIAANLNTGTSLNLGQTLASAMNANFVLNCQRGGREMVDALNDFNNIATSSPSWASVDAVNIFLGTNDWAFNTSLGTIADSTATATFYGLTKKAVEQLLTWKPTLLVSLSTLLYRTGGTAANSVGHTMQDYSQAIRDVAALYSLPLFDLEKVCSISAFNAATMLSDGLHPNATGDKLLYARFLGFYRTIYPQV